MTFVNTDFFVNKDEQGRAFSSIATRSDLSFTHRRLQPVRRRLKQAQVTKTKLCHCQAGFDIGAARYTELYAYAYSSRFSLNMFRFGPINSYGIYEGVDIDDEKAFRELPGSAGEQMEAYPGHSTGPADCNFRGRVYRLWRLCADEPTRQATRRRRSISSITEALSTNSAIRCSSARRAILFFWPFVYLLGGNHMAVAIVQLVISLSANFLIFGTIRRCHRDALGRRHSGSVLHAGLYPLLPQPEHRRRHSLCVSASGGRRISWQSG